MEGAIEGTKAEQMMAERILVTGGASGLGRAIALRFASAGAKVCITDLHAVRGAQVQEELQALVPECFFHHASVTDARAWQSLTDLLVQRWGGMDVVVNNAGVAGASGAVEEVPLDAWQQILDINLLGVVRGCQAFVPVFKRQHSGYFINIASAAGLFNAPMMAAYNVSKAGVIALSETLRSELAPYDVGVSVVCPSFFETNLLESLGTGNSEGRAYIRRLMASSSLTADDIAGIIYDGYGKRQFLILAHREVKTNWLIKRYLPSLFDYLLVAKTRNFLKLRSTNDDAGAR